jgi:c-di-GMP-binding flagellar brake protein YcgR
VAEITVTIRTGWRTLTAQSVNIGEGGIAVVCSTRMSVGEEVGVAFSLPGQQQIISGTAVVRHVTGYEHGLEFWGVSAEDRDFVAAFVNARVR